MGLVFPGEPSAFRAAANDEREVDVALLQLLICTAIQAYVVIAPPFATSQPPPQRARS
jgi:hypothetical protein